MVKGYADAFAAAGCDELIFVPTTAAPDQSACSTPRPGRAADGGQVAEDRVAVAAEAVDTLAEPFGLVFQQFRRLGGQALGGQVDPARQERQDPADDLGGEAGVEQAADLLDPVHVGGVVAAVSVAVPFGMEQVLLLVVAKQPGRDAGPAGQLTDQHRAGTVICLHISVKA
jgi:hypothetical protein